MSSDQRHARRREFAGYLYTDGKCVVLNRAPKAPLSLGRSLSLSFLPVEHERGAKIDNRQTSISRSIGQAREQLITSRT